MGKGLMQKAERHGTHKNNGMHKTLLRSLGFRNTDKEIIKNWVKSRSVSCKHLPECERPVVVLYDGMVGSFKTWAEACYEMAILERRKGKRI